MELSGLTIPESFHEIPEPSLGCQDSIVEGHSPYENSNNVIMKLLYPSKYSVYSSETANAADFSGRLNKHS